MGQSCGSSSDLKGSAADSGGDAKKRKKLQKTGENGFRGKGELRFTSRFADCVHEPREGSAGQPFESLEDGRSPPRIGWNSLECDAGAGVLSFRAMRSGRNNGADRQVILPFIALVLARFTYAEKLTVMF
jgi:hypothetical protein